MKHYKTVMFVQIRPTPQ